MKKAFTVLIPCLVFCLLFSALPLVQAPTAKAQTSSSFGTAFVPSVKFEDRAGSYFFNVSTYCIEFFKDTQGYDKIYDGLGQELAYDIRFSLEYLSGANWKQRGTATSVQVKKISDSQYEVTRYYNDFVCTIWKTVYDVKSQTSTKVSVEINNGATSTYRLLWSLSGITNTVASESVNSVTFKTDVQATDNFFVDWNDVYASFGSITSAVLSDVAQGRKLDLTFSIGNVNAGKKLFLDPSFGYEGSVAVNYGLGDEVVGSQFTLTTATAGTITATGMMAKFYYNADNKPNATLAIYKASDNSSVATTQQLTLDVGSGIQWIWYNFTFSSNPTLTNNTAYWLCAFGSSDNAMIQVSGLGGGTGYYSDAETYPSFPNPYAPTLVGANRAVAIVCNYTIGDSTAPTYSSLSTSTTVAGASCNFNATFNDETALESDGQYKFGTNQTGSWVWDTPVNFTSTPETASVTKTLTNTYGLVIGYQWNFTDNAGNSNNTGVQTLTTTADTYTVTLSASETALTVGGTVTVTIAVSRSTGTAVSSWTADITNNGDLWKDDYADSSFFFTEINPTGHKFDVTSLYDADCGATVTPTCTELHVIWQVAGGGGGGGAGDGAEPTPTPAPTMPPTIPTIPTVPTQPFALEEPNSPVLVIIIGVCVVSLIGIIVYVDQSSQSGWKKLKKKAKKKPNWKKRK